MHVIQRTRRQILKTAGVCAAGVVLPGAAVSAQTHHTFVLVHGAWHGGWCWRRVADRLQAAGHTVYTPTLTGLGERSHLMSRDITLDTHITDIVNVFKWEGIESAVLCGHSYGGFPIAGAVEQCYRRWRRSCSLTHTCHERVRCDGQDD
jgi:pimeloyl-ACP methyl ester carboxylesterase